MATDLQIEEEFAQRKMDKNLFARIWAFTQPYRKRYYLNILLALIATGLSLIGPKIIQIALDRCILAGNLRALASVSGIFLANLLLSWGLTIVQPRSVTFFGH